MDYAQNCLNGFHQCVHVSHALVEIPIPEHWSLKGQELLTSHPEIELRRWRKVWSIRPALVRSTTARAVSTMISECWNQWLRGPAEPRPPSRNPFCGTVRDPRNAGASPKANV